MPYQSGFYLSDPTNSALGILDPVDDDATALELKGSSAYGSLPLDPSTTQSLVGRYTAGLDASFHDDVLLVDAAGRYQVLKLNSLRDGFDLGPGGQFRDASNQTYFQPQVMALRVEPGTWSDVAVYDAGSGRLSVQRFDPDTGFSTTSALEVTTTSGLIVRAGRFGRDSFSGLVVYAIGSGVLSIYSFLPPSVGNPSGSLQLFGSGSLATQLTLAVGDFNGDGRDDLFGHKATSPAGTYFSYFTTTDPLIPLIAGPSGSGLTTACFTNKAYRTSAADVDGDGDDDILAYAPCTGNARAYVFDSDQTNARACTAGGPCEIIANELGNWGLGRTVVTQMLTNDNYTRDVLAYDASTRAYDVYRILRRTIPCGGLPRPKVCTELAASDVLPIGGSVTAARFEEPLLSIQITGGLCARCRCLTPLPECEVNCSWQVPFTFTNRTNGVIAGTLALSSDASGFCGNWENAGSLPVSIPPNGTTTVTWDAGGYLGFFNVTTSATFTITSAADPNLVGLTRDISSQQHGPLFRVCDDCR